jgi:hypothetical protein
MVKALKRELSPLANCLTCGLLRNSIFANKEQPQGNLLIVPGEREDVEVFIDAARVGPARALVASIDVVWQPLVDEKNNFEIEENGAHRAPTERG